MSQQLDNQPLINAVKKSATLCSIFDRVSDTGKAPKGSRNPLVATVLANENIIKGGVKVSQELLADDLRLLDKIHPDAQGDTYTYLLQKYGWRIGMPDGPEVQDVAFCDAVRLEQALSNVGPDGYLLVKGELSGIQGYIYGNIQQKTAGGLSQVAKRLRGRSILVTLLTDFLANVVLRELNCSASQLLFAGGGHFNLLLPNSLTMRTELQELTEKIGNEMRLFFDDRLQLIIADVACTSEEVLKEAGRCFERLNAARERKKHSQHQSSLKDHFYPSQKSAVDDPDKRDDWEIRIGERFPKRHILIEAVSDGSLFHDRNETELLSLNMNKNTYTLLMEETLKKSEELLSGVTGLVSAQVFSLNNTDFLPKKDDWTGKVLMPVSFGFRFLGKTVPLARYQHQKSNKVEIRPQTFEEIARGLKDGEMESEAHRIPLEMLGSMRLDVDDLGYIFSQGLGKDASLGQLVSLSREIHYFFSAHFDQLAQKHDLYLIYSGGDDAFVVGKWDRLIEFAKQLQADFQELVFQNTNVHFSAGLFFGDPRYPVGRFYHDAGNLQDAAKESNRNKDRVHIFNHPLSWTAYQSKIKFGTGIAEMLAKGDGKSTRKLTMAFAYRLLLLVKTSFHERTGIDEGGKEYRRGSLNMRRFARNVANMRYLFARNGYDKSETEKVLEGIEKELINDFLRNFDFGDKGNMNAVRDNLVALNFALYKIRSQKN
jgi:CRISPR-associated protein Csm1